MRPLSSYSAGQDQHSGGGVVEHQSKPLLVRLTSAHSSSRERYETFNVISACNVSYRYFISKEATYTGTLPLALFIYCY